MSEQQRKAAAARGVVALLQLVQQWEETGSFFIDLLVGTRGLLLWCSAMLPAADLELEECMQRSCLPGCMPCCLVVQRVLQASRCSCGCAACTLLSGRLVVAGVVMGQVQ